MTLTGVRRAARARSAGPQIKDIKSSFIWTRLVPDVFKGQYKGPAAALASRPRYTRAFGRGQSTPIGFDDRFLFPWERPVGQLFWSNYLSLYSLDDVPGKEAWQALVPLRERLSVSFTSEIEGASAYAECFYYPHGLGLVVTLRARTMTGSLARRVEQFRRLVWETDLRLLVDDVVEQGRMADVAGKAVNHLLRQRLDPDAGAAGGQARPFSVTAIIQGAPIDANVEPASNGGLRRALHALAGWSPSWQNDTLGDLKDVSIRRSKKPAGHLLYTADRGRVVWFPAHFDTSSQRRRHSLSCYQRNLTFASLTIESLTGLLANFDDYRRSGGQMIRLPADHRDCLRNAAVRLANLYTGTNTYRTRSAPLQITANGGKDVVNRLANDLGIGALP